ncbi:MAG TPA: RAMP superfamily CRISPR-associated protein, partial [Chthonomonadales bacterium]|nr:RAMP superfamily CRISPR-associated protein [Chthonomonadales bacterium]
MMDPINLELRLVTPAYTGGADTEVADGLRPPTLKALLRFWWRAMHPELKPQELFAREEALFGSTSAGQRLSIIPVGPINTMSECPARYTTDVKPPLFYLAYGTQGDRQSNPRPRAKADTTYRYRLILSPAMTVEDRSEIFKALWLLGAIGGCGTRSRRGFGSLEIVSASLDLPHRPAADTQAALVTWLKSGVERICTPVFDGLPEHTAFSKRARLVCGPERGTWEDALIAA